MTEISLHGGEIALVDEADAPMVGQFKWRASAESRVIYALRTLRLPSGRKTTEAMHSFLTGWSFVDHINGNGLDNRRGNLRETNDSLNQGNRRKALRPTSSRFKGVCWNRACRRWQVVIQVGGKKAYLGLFSDELEAARAYDTKARVVFGDFAALNLPLPGERSALTGLLVTQGAER